MDFQKACDILKLTKYNLTQKILKKLIIAKRYFGILIEIMDQKKDFKKYL